MEGVLIQLISYISPIGKEVITNNDNNVIKFEDVKEKIRDKIRIKAFCKVKESLEKAEELIE